jgi:hypothetical protein
MISAILLIASIAAAPTSLSELSPKSASKFAGLSTAGQACNEPFLPSHQCAEGLVCTRRFDLPGSSGLCLQVSQEGGWCDERGVHPMYQHVCDPSQPGLKCVRSVMSDDVGGYGLCTYTNL